MRLYRDYCCSVRGFEFEAEVNLDSTSLDFEVDFVDFEDDLGRVVQVTGQPGTSLGRISESQQVSHRIVHCEKKKGITHLVVSAGGLIGP